MNKIPQLMMYATLFSAITSCTNLETSTNKDNSTTFWDFDHNLQFKQTKLADKHFQLEIIPNNKVNFERLATFLLRKSYRLCGGYHYKIEMIQGIEGFDDKRAMPNYIFPSLIAKIKC
ncbi:hypothetical protein [Candidatus Colwellia aromaticivorans]|uniref:hypothetical protein n=1 Tax=Candidatus Colwellia aromaticivorans TaxID=2267621 RepID=UPI001FEA8477|nr:hypothetical protein [Candidatus Colwellia aromaticivorans]